MKAVLLEEYGARKKLRYTTTNLPPHCDNEVRVRVPARHVGRDLAGEVEAAGRNVAG